MLGPPNPTASPRRLLTLLVPLLLGTVARLAYGLLHKPWLDAPDQLAWQVLVQEASQGGCCSADQLIHYPHEGGSLLSGLLAVLLEGMGPLPSLSLAALLLDACSRLIQLWVVRRHAVKGVYQAFAAWTVVGYPFLLPWGTVNYGLHALAAFVPFVLLHLVLDTDKGWRLWAAGGVAAMCIWFSYDTWVLVPAWLTLMVMKPELGSRKFAFVPLMALVLILHVWWRGHIDAGFHLRPIAAVSIRGIAWDPAAANWLGLLQVWWQSLPTALGFSNAILGYVMALLMVLGLVLALVQAIRQGARWAYAGFAFVICFVVAYALSPFYVGHSAQPHYAAFRHWPFLLPFFTWVGYQAIGGMRFGKPVLAGMVAICAFGLGLGMTGERHEGWHVRETGHVLGTKLGHSPQRLSPLVRRYPEREEQLLQGIGWGMAQAMLRPDTADVQQMDALMALVEAYPPDQRRQVQQGVVYAFSEWTNPRLPLAQLQQLRFRYPGLQGVTVVR